MMKTLYAVAAAVLLATTSLASAAEKPLSIVLVHGAFVDASGWQKVYSDDIATIHVRKSDAVHTAEPVVDPKTK